MRRRRLVDAYAQGAALYDAMSVAETPGAMVADDAGARWPDIQRRAAGRLRVIHPRAPRR
jgi:hypothetical protein